MTQRRNWHVAGMMALPLVAIGFLLAGCDSKPTETKPAALSAADHQAAFEKKLAALRPKAEAGDPLAQFEMGKAYEEGMASGAKSPAGDGAQKDPLIDLEKAAAWYEKAANQGNAEAQYRLGMLWLQSQTDGPTDAPQQHPRDASKAATWLEKAAEQKHAEAAYQLAQLYESGTGVEQNEQAANKNYLVAAENGHAGAQYAWGLVVFKAGLLPQLAAEWWNKAAAQGHADAQFQLAWLYAHGIGVEKDEIKATQWWEKSANQGNAEAQSNLGTAYETGVGVPKDASKAAEWYLKSARQGEQSGQLNLARLYATGDGVEQDSVLTYAWANLAAANPQGSADMASRATKGRLKLEQAMSRAEISEAQRISSSWKPGQPLKRESASADGGAGSTGKLEKTGTGTLFIVNKNGAGITNQHVVGGCTELRIQGRDGVAKLMTEDKVNDLALVRIPGKVGATATIASKPESLRQGEDIVVFGFPLNAVLSSGGNLTPGMVSALTGLGNNTNQVQITAPIQPGSSGSPVLNKKGEVVGVVAMKLSDSKMARATGEIGQNVNFAVSGQTLKAFLDKHKVDYRNGAGFFAWGKDASDLAEAARTWTTVVECWR